MSRPPKPRAPWLVRLFRAAFLTLIGLSLLALLLTGATAAVQAALETRIAPGVRIGDVSLDGLTREEAATALRERYGAAESVAYTLRDGTESWTASAAEFGLRLPVDALVERAYRNRTCRIDAREPARIGAGLAGRRRYPTQHGL